MRHPPEGRTDLRNDLCMSNLDHEIPDDMEDRLQTEKFIGHHAAENFYGDVWFEDGLFHESVYRFHEFVDHYEAPTLRELMTEVNDENGWE